MSVQFCVELTCFCKTPVKDLQDFKWSLYVCEMETKSLLMLKLMRKIVSHSDIRNNAKQGMSHDLRICMATAVLLKDRNRETMGLQTYFPHTLQLTCSEAGIGYFYEISSVQ